MPYTYLIGWSNHRIYYYGRRTALNCHPKELWITYKTSSNYVKQFVEEFGDPDIIQIRKIFTCKEKCAKWESKVLRRLGAAKSLTYLNKTNGDESWDVFNSTIGCLNPNYGKRLYHNPYTMETIRCTPDECPVGWNPGYPPNIKHPSKDKNIYHNPETEEHRIFGVDEIVPNNWVKGRSDNRKKEYVKESPNVGTSMYYHPETNKRIYLKKDDIVPNGFIKGGGKISENQKENLSSSHKGRVPYHNPETGKEIRIKPNDEVPFGYIKGRSEKFKNSISNSHKKNIYVLPHGEFKTIVEAYRSTHNTDFKISKDVCGRYFKNLDVVITQKMFLRTAYLRYFFKEDDCVGKTLKECGFLKKEA